VTSINANHSITFNARATATEAGASAVAAAAAGTPLARYAGLLALRAGVDITIGAAATIETPAVHASADVALTIAGGYIHAPFSPLRVDCSPGAAAVRETCAALAWSKKSPLPLATN
jgi:hypothetical protein